MRGGRSTPRGTTALEGTLYVVATLLCIPCIPCICLVGGGVIATELVVKARAWENPVTRRRREEKERRREMVRCTPRKMRPRLERHLTIGRPEREEGARGEDEGKRGEVVGLEKVMTVTEQQAESRLFNLPLEIRRSIWEEVLGGYVMHVRFLEAYRQMGHTRCKSLSPEICKGTPCRKVSKVAGVPDAWGNVALLPLLQSCRRIYSEAIEILYTENTFDFNSLNDVLKLSLTILPERMRLIKSVQWRPDFLTYLNSTPWLDCRAPRACSCITCWPKAIGYDEVLRAVYDGRPES